MVSSTGVEIKMTRISTFAICLGLGCFFLTGTGLAGTTATTVIDLGDCTPGPNNRVITVPANTVTRQINVVRVTTQDLIMRVSLGSGFEFTTGTLPASTDLSLNVVAEGVLSPLRRLLEERMATPPSPFSWTSRLALLVCQPSR